MRTGTIEHWVSRRNSLRQDDTTRAQAASEVRLVPEDKNKIATVPAEWASCSGVDELPE